jgi:MarR-like DNA-binding transcriptional regulator SgrR of sgrS sRNA
MVRGIFMTLIRLLMVGLATISQESVSQGATTGNSVAEVRVYNDFDLPLEPATLYSMSEYNLSLCLFSTLFVLDDGSVPRSDILASWKYSDELAAYDFEIKAGIIWSDGRPFTASDIKTSITRLQKVAPTHYKSIASLLVFPSSGGGEDAGIEILSDKVIRFHVGHPTPDLFARLTTSFIPMVRSDLLDPVSQRVARHDVTLGPYTLDARTSNKAAIRLIKNASYFLKNEGMAPVVEMRPYSGTIPRAEEITKPGSWPNLILDRAFTTKEGWEKIREAKASVWTRPVDRVLYLFPSRAGMKRDMAGLLRWLGAALAKGSIWTDEFPGVQAARSLQPNGFFVHQPISFAPGRSPKGREVVKIAVLNQQIPGHFLKMAFAALGLKIEYDLLPISKGKEAQESGKYDLMAASFGAADPDPVTWLSLVLGNEREFIGDYDHAYRHEFEKIKDIRDSSVRVERLRELITRAGAQGLYVPLAHFSSIAVADHTLDLSRIRASDETVDISKVIVRRP